MSGTERMACPECGTENPMLGVVSGTRQYLCRKCGQAYYTPDTCLSKPANAEKEKTLSAAPKSPARPGSKPESRPGK